MIPWKPVLLGRWLERNVRGFREALADAIAPSESRRDSRWFDETIPDMLRLTEVSDRGTDGRLRASGVNSVLEATVGEIVDKERFRGARVLEIGPKFGYHSRWIDTNLHPTMLTMIELPSKEVHLRDWLPDLTCPHEVIYKSLFTCSELFEREPYDLVFCTGVLYHTVEHFKLLHILYRLLRDDGMVLFQTSIDPTHKGPTINLQWKARDQKGSYAFPTLAALYRMLAMTGWTDVERFTKYRPASNTVLMTLRKAPEPPVSYDGLPFGGSTV